VAILFMKDANVKLKLAASGSLVEYNTQVASAEIEVSPGDEVQYPTLDGNVASNVGPPSYALVLRAGQDYSTDGLARFLWENEGELLDFDYQAHGAGTAEGADTPKVTGQCRAVPGAYGGEVGTFAEIEVSLPCAAKPTLDETP
jgi:hypothetical protein